VPSSLGICAAEVLLSGFSLSRRPWEEIIGPWLEIRSSTSVSEVLEKCVNKPQAQWTQADQNRVGRCLRILGWERYRERERERLEWRWRGLPNEVPRHSMFCSQFVLRQVFGEKNVPRVPRFFRARVYAESGYFSYAHAY
jgi:hypothetical protein